MSIRIYERNCDKRGIVSVLFSGKARVSMKEGASKVSIESVDLGAACRRPFGECQAVVWMRYHLNALLIKYGL
jgi:hypothetical protein